MSKQAIRIPDGVARLFPAVVVALAALVGSAVGATVAVQRYRAATDTVSAPMVVQVQAPQPVTPSPIELPSPTELPPPATIATPLEDRTDATSVEDRTVSDSSPSAPIKVERHASKEKVSQEPVVRKSAFDWQAATAHAGSNRAEATGATTPGVAPAATANAVADASSDTTSNARVAAPLTINGCLEMSVDGQTFRLSDTEGANVPKARNWRSGFLKKEAAPVELVELTDRATVRRYVGQRVTATGVVENREMRVRSLQATGNACD